MAGTCTHIIYKYNIMCCTTSPLLVHDQRVGTRHDVDDDDKLSRSEDLVRDPRVGMIPVAVVVGDSGGWWSGLQFRAGGYV